MGTAAAREKMVVTLFQAMSRAKMKAMYEPENQWANNLF
jgi:hypothetical protein